MESPARTFDKPTQLGYTNGVFGLLVEKGETKVTVGYDVIGDIHGSLPQLFCLLEHMGYERTVNGLYHHKNRKAVFVGDLIDRGNFSFETYEFVRAMVEHEYAICVMGNHEFNAIMAYYGYRKLPKNDVHYPLHKDMSERPNEYKIMIEWFQTLPVCLTIGNLHVIHACYDPERIDLLKTMGILTDDCRITDGVYALYQKEKTIREPLKAILKGTERKLPDGISFLDKDGNKRTKVRVKWWIEDDYVPNGEIAVIGHYWLKSDRPNVLSDNVACVDYSCVKGGFLCAYRYNVGDTNVSNEQFEHLP